MRGLHAESRFWHCKTRKKQFSVTAGMPMHRTHPPLLTWAQATYLVVFSFRNVLIMNFAGMLECMMAEAAPIPLPVELGAMDAGASSWQRARRRSATRRAGARPSVAACDDQAHSEPRRGGARHCRATRSLRLQRLASGPRPYRVSSTASSSRTVEDP